MDSLPTEMIRHILRYLDVNDLLIVRQVNKKCKFVVENDIRIVQLAIRSGTEVRFTKLFFELNYRSVELGHQLHIVGEDIHCNLFNSGLMKFERLLKNLRRLFIDQHCLNYPNAMFSVLIGINQLSELEQLEIRSISLERPEKLRLKKLRILSIGRLRGRHLKLSTPSLKHFDTEDNLNLFEFEYPERLTHLSTHKFEEINEFTNLTHLYLRNFEYDREPLFRVVPIDILTLLPHLQEIHCRNWSRQVMVANIIASKIMLRRKQFRFFQFGVPIDSLDELPEFAKNAHENYLMDGETKAYFKLMLRHYSKLNAVLPWATNVYYDDIVDHFPGHTELERLEVDGFIRQFMNIRKVVVEKRIEDPVAFTRFIQKCKELRDLELREAGLDAVFFDRLSRYQPFIESLEIKSFTTPAIDLKFVLKFKRLSSFRTNQPIEFQLIEQLLNAIDFDDFQFGLRGKTVSLYSPGSGGEIVIDDEEVDCDSLSALIEFVRKLMVCVL